MIAPSPNRPIPGAQRRTRVADTRVDPAPSDHPQGRFSLPSNQRDERGPQSLDRTDVHAVV